jgi:hypothetical protein
LFSYKTPALFKNCQALLYVEIRTYVLTIEITRDKNIGKKTFAKLEAKNKTFGRARLKWGHNR